MERLIGRKPSPAMVIAVIALILAVGGTATAALNSKDKKKVKKIADQEITKKASGLSVAKAGDADKLGGTAATGFQKGSGHTYNGLATAAPSTNNNPILVIPGIGTVQFDCDPGGVSATPELLSATGLNSMSALGQTQIGAAATMDPNTTTLNDGGTLALANRGAGTTTLQVWGQGKTATITVSGIFCSYTASAITNQ